MNMMEDAPVLSSSGNVNMSNGAMDQGLSSMGGEDAPMSVEIQGMSVEMGGHQGQGTTSPIVFGQGAPIVFGQGAAGGQKIRFGQGASQPAGSGIKFGGGGFGGGLSFGSNI